MAKIRRTARITVAEAPPEEDSVVYRAWMIWKSARDEAARQGDQPFLNGETGIYGVRLDGSIHRHMVRLYPEYESFLTEDERTAFSRPIYGFLNGSGNAICVVRGTSKRKSVWWLSKEWIDTHTTIAPGDQSRLEERLTPDEVGETLPPAPVQTRWRCNECGKEFDSEGARNGHQTTHRAEKTCPHCGKRVKNVGAHALHAHGITAKGKFRCRTCHKEFDTKSQRDGHMVVHSGTPDNTVGKSKTVVVTNVDVESERTPSEGGTTDDTVALAEMLAQVVQTQVAKATGELLERLAAAEQRAKAAEDRLEKLRKALGE